ncbi:MAG: plasmid replication protein RepC [Aestuariivita sp.]|nr:plasmid replication protein RepC [Aestuariivita sp.]MCY4345352.1 plasmid replication protein RepC [Aestuariivita sp.]
MKILVNTETTSASLTSLSRNGWRKAPENIWLTEEFANDGALRDVSRNRAAAAVKAVAAAIGLKSGSILLLDVMLSLSAPQDWAANCRPIVWPGNIALMEKTGLSLSALRRHIKVLEKTGLIICRDSANGRRFGHRDKKGVIVEAYGFDLSPLKARVEDFEALGQQLKQERVACQQLRNKITSTRRTARALIQHACDGVIEGIWAELTADLDDLLATKLSRKPTSEELKSRLDALTSLLQQIKEAVVPIFKARLNAKTASAETPKNGDNCPNMAPLVVHGGAHIQTTSEESTFVTCNGGENVEEQQPASSSPATGGDAAAGDPAPQTAKQADTAQKSESETIALNTIMQASPQFTQWAHQMYGHIGNWEDLYRAAAQLRSAIGLKVSAWNAVDNRLGPLMTAIAFVLVFEKFNEQAIRSPNAYFVALSAKAHAGKLYLARSFYGRLSRQNQAREARPSMARH